MKRIKKGNSKDGKTIFLTKLIQFNSKFHLVQIKRKKYLLPIWPAHCSFCMPEYFSSITWLQDHVPCQLLIFLYIYNKWWINYIRCSLKSHSQRSQWHLLLMTKGEEASVGIILTTVTPQKTLQVLVYRSHCTCTESKGRRNWVIWSWEERTMTPL